MTVTLEVLSEGGRPLVVKRADGPHVSRLHIEAERLQAASHPGVVQVVSSGPRPGGWELRLVHAGRPLDVVGLLPAVQVAAVAASVAATLADLHMAGIVHGRVDPSHVLLGSHGRPVLCGFAGEPGRTAEPADDVAGVGELIVAMLGSEGDGEPIPERRWRLRRTWTGGDRQALLTLADQACAEPASRRPSARRLAAAVSQLVPPDVASVSGTLGPPSAPLSPEGGPPDDPLDALRASAIAPPARPRPRPLSVVLAALGVAALVVGVHRSGEPEAPDGVAAVLPPPTVGGDAVVAAPTVPPAPSPTTAPAACGAVGGVDLDGDGCREAVRVDGRRIEVGDAAFLVGTDGDDVVVRDWDCDGNATPAVFRPRTGEVFVFPRWDVSADVVVEPVATVPGGRELVVASGSEPCSGLGVRTDSTVVEIVRPSS